MPTISYDTLLEQLRRGTNQLYSSMSTQWDRHTLTLDGSHVLCARFWLMEDEEGSNQGRTSALIAIQEVKPFLEQVVEKGFAERIFDSTNTWRSSADDAQGKTVEEINQKLYPGRAKLSIYIINDAAEFVFLPTPPRKPGFLLTQDWDYL